MGRTFIVDECVQKTIQTAIQCGSVAVGILVGQQTSGGKDYVVHAVVTPPEESDESETPVSTLDSIEDSWVANHAKQVECMMPGGVTVLGIFAVGKPDDMAAAPVKLRQIVFAVHKVLSKLRVITDDSEVTEKVVLQVCALTNKITCRTFDVSDHKSAAKPADWKYQALTEPWSAAKPADWKYQALTDRWVRLSASVCVDFNIPVTSEMGKKSLKRQIQTGILPTCENVWNSIAVLNKHLYDDTDPLDPQSGGGGGGKSGGGGGGGKKKKQGKDDSRENLCFEVDLFSHTPKVSPTEPPSIEDCCAKMYVRGTVCSRAFLHNKTLAKEAIQALKSDAILTLYRRCELLCEDMLLDEEEQDPKILYETPRRVFAPLPGTSLEICDYIFMDETEENVQGRLRELLGVDVNEEDIDIHCETIPEEADLIRPDVSELLDTSMPSPESRSKAKAGGGYIGMLLGGAIAALVAGMSYMYLGES